MDTALTSGQAQPGASRLDVVFWVRHRYPAPAPAAPSKPVGVGEVERHACIQALVALLLADELSEEEFELRWNSALEATTSTELDLLRYDADSDDEAGGASAD